MSAIIKAVSEFRSANRLAALLCSDDSIAAGAAFGGMADVLVSLAAKVATHAGPLSYENEGGAGAISESELNDWLDSRDVRTARLFASPIPDDDAALVVCLRVWLTTDISGVRPHNVTMAA